MGTPDRAWPARAAAAVGSLGGLGRLPRAPGTAGAAAAALVAAALPDRHYAVWVALLLAFAVVVAPAAARAVAAAGAGDDPPAFVLDEAAGMWLAALHPARPSPAVLFAAFIAFRLFDIWKPGPIARLERVGRGWGVVLDDLAAGVLALGVSLLVAVLLDRAAG